MMQEKHKGETILYLVNPGEIKYTIIQAEHLKLVKKYQYLDGTDAIYIYSGRV